MKLLVVVFSVIALYSAAAVSKPEELDKVSVIVDQGVVLESEIAELVASVKSNAIANDQALPADRVLRTQAIERLIVSNLQMQMAERMGIRISDPQLEQTIGNIAQGEGISIDELRNQLAAEGISYDTYREQVRKELITGEVRRANVRRRVYITPQEIANLVKLIDEQGAQQAEYRLGHILVGFPPQPTDDDIKEAKERAEKVLELLNGGSDFAKIAITASSGANALEGGDMGWMDINSMPTLFAEAVQDKEKDSLIGPIRSGAGFHILKITDLRGVEKAEFTELNSRHILIKPSVIVSEDKARQMLAGFRKQLLAGEADFAVLAKEHSADPGSALKGGDLGWTDPNNYVAEFRDTINSMKVGEISEPFRSVHGWHMVELTGRRVGDATEKLKEEKAYQLLFNRKFAEEAEAWIREMRDSAYVEVLDPDGKTTG